MEESGVDSVSVAVFGKYLAQHKGFLIGRNITYSRTHTRDGNILRLERISEGRECDEG